MNDAAPLLRVCSLLNQHREIADEVEVDVSTRAWKTSYADAVGTSLKATIQDIEIPYLDLKTLVASKQTNRDQDRVDVRRLLSPDRQ